MNADISTTRSIETLSPFRHSAEVHSAVPTELRGQIPDWLRGEVVRTCPAIDAGVLLTVGSAKDRESSLLAVIDAKTMALVASARVSSSVPLGFHGSFARAGSP